MRSKSAVRKLAAIFYADIAGYSRLSGVDEEGTHQRAMEVLDFTSEMIGNSKGTVLRYAGDAILAEFSSVVVAVNTSCNIQSELNNRSIEVPEDQKVQLRIGINFGDVIQDRGEVYGDGVNLAARLEATARPGGICITAAVHDQIEGKVNFTFNEGGEKLFKNMSKPVRIYHWPGSQDAIPPDAQLESLPLPDKPSIAVLPFDNLSGDPEQEYICDGMTEEILTALASIPDLFVIARNSSFVYKGKAVNVGDVGRDLGVRYVLEGSVRRSGNNVRVTAQLIEADSSNHLWAERYDRNLDDIFDLQDEISREVAIALQTKLEFDATLYRFQGGTRNHRAWQLCLKGIDKYNKHNRADNADCSRLLEEAVSLDPKYEGALSMLGWANYAGLRWGFLSKNDSIDALARLKEIIDILQKIDPEHGDAHFLTCALRIIECDIDGAVMAGENAIEKKPNDPNTHAYLAQVYSYSGRLEEALSQIKYAMRLSPHHPTWMLGTIGDIHYRSGKHDDAIKYAQLGTARARDSIPLHAQLAAFFGATGRIEEGKEAVARLYELDSKYSISKYEKIQLPVDTRYTEEMSAGLRQLGIGE